MLFRILLILAIVLAIVYYIMRKRNIQISLTPLGRNALVMVVRQIIRLLMRRIGF